MFLSVICLQASAADKSSGRSYRIPAGFEHLLEQESADVDILLSGEKAGQGQIYITQDIVRFGRINLSHKAIKPAALLWLDQELRKGIPMTGFVCKSLHRAQFGCLEGNRLVRVHYKPERLIVELLVDVSLLQESSDTGKHFLPLSSSEHISGVIDYTLNQSYSPDNEHYLFNFGTTFSKRERHVRTAIRNVYNQQEKQSEQYGELSEFYYRDDQQGTQFTAGLQQQWDFYNNLAGSKYFHPREDVIAVSWGTSVRTGDVSWSSSVFPVQVFMPEAGRVEIYRNDALLATEAAAAGLNTLKTTYWPQGVYDVEIRTYIFGKLYDTQRQTVFKDSSGSSRKASSLWAGVGAPVKRRIYGEPAKQDANHYKALFGGSFSYPLSAGVSFNSAAYLSEVSSALELGSRIIFPNNTPLTLSVLQTQYQSNGVNLRLSGRVRRFSLAGTYEYFYPHSDLDKSYYMGERNRWSGYINYYSSSHQSVMLSLRQDLSAQRFTQSLSYRRRFQLTGRDQLDTQISLQHGDRVTENCQMEDVFVAAGLSANLRFTWVFGENSAGRNRLSLEYSNSSGQPWATSADYHYPMQSDWIQDIGLSGRLTREDYQFWGSTRIEAPVLDGSIGTSLYGNTDYRGWGVHTNLSGQLGIVGDNLAVGRGTSRSGALLQVTDSGVGALKAEVNGRPYRLDQSVSFVPLAPFQTHKMVIKPLEAGLSAGTLQLEKNSYYCTAYPGNAFNYLVDAWYAVDVIGRIVDEQDQPISHLLLTNSRSQAITDLDGTFSMVLDSAELEFRGKQGTNECVVNVDEQVKGLGEQPFYRLGKLVCRLQRRPD